MSMLQRQHAGHAPDRAPPIVHAVLHAGGQPLDATTRAAMEPRFGHDFSQVRVHADAQAAASAQAVNALAYTVGPHVVFGAGQYAPHTRAGQRLLAHELTHVVQQRQASPGSRLEIDHPASPAEREAEHAANSEHVTHVGNMAPASLQRQPQPDVSKPSNLGPPVQEVPLPPVCSIIWEDGKWSWKCERLPGIGSTPKIPLDPRDIPDRIRELLPKGSGTSPGPRTFPLPPAPGSDLPPNWLEDVCKRNPMSVLCLPPGGQKQPEQPGPGSALGLPTGVFWTWDVLFEHDQPSPQGGGPNGGMTAEGVSSLNAIISLLSSDPTLQARLIGHASSEGDTAHNLELSRRRVQLIYQRLEAAKLGGQVMNPIEPDGKTEGCTRVDFGVWACGEQNATPGEARPEERKVAVTFLRNPPLPGGPLKLTLPQLGGAKQ